MSMNVMDVFSFCEVATDSIQKSIEAGNYDGAHVQLCSYLLELYSRYQSNEINLKIWQETMRFYRRMTMTVIEECNIHQQN